MKNLNILIVSLLLCMGNLSSCGEKDPDIPVDDLFRGVPIVEVEDGGTLTVNGVSFTMISIKGGTFTMGATLEQGIDANSDEKPAHLVTLSDYYIGQTEVTQALWEAVMGSNPSVSKGKELPVENVSWNDCQEFVQKLNQYFSMSQFDMEFRLPTEAEWEYAARGGNKSGHYEFSGSNTIEDVAWFCGNSSDKTQPVATKQPNELGIYDMSGNVSEWCQDWYGSYSASAQTNPIGIFGSSRVYRGSNSVTPTGLCRISNRNSAQPDSKSGVLGLRLVVADVNSEEPNPEPENVETFTANGTSFKMVFVEGGTFTMGATSEQGDYVESDEKPTHQVSLSDYYIGQTEVTQALWEAVMGNNPSNFVGSDLPVEMVSWSSCQDFVKKLSELTGRTFRLPTEAEWEYAARGGKKSKGYMYSGSNSIDPVAWWNGNSTLKTHSVGFKQPNELGIYDMNGNVWEWCLDGYSNYSSTAQTNPVAPFNDSNRVIRGAGCISGLLHVSNRVGYPFYFTCEEFGLRVVLSTEEPEPDPEPENVETFTANGVSFNMVTVEGGTFIMGATSEQGDDAVDSEKPAHSVTLSDYAIGQTEVTQALWAAVMGNNPSYYKGDYFAVEYVTWYDCRDFVSKLNELTGKRFRLPTEAEWEYAARGGNKSKGYKYSGSNTIDDVAWYLENKQTHAVATKQRNELGLYDMSGNVEEWCRDWYGSYSNEAQTNPVGPSDGSYRIFRGGSYSSGKWSCRVSVRADDSPNVRRSYRGLRLALSK